MSKVLRLRAGAQVECFDGDGSIFMAELASSGRREMRLKIKELISTEPPPAVQTHLGIAVLKGAAMDRCLQLSVELGATHITLLTTARTNVALGGDRLENRLKHWQKIIIGACEQSGVLHIPQLSELLSLDDFVRLCGSGYALDMAGEVLPSAAASGDFTACIGPEGGWSDAEKSLFQRAGWPFVSVAANTLRAETVPAVVLAVLNHLRQA